MAGKGSKTHSFAEWITPDLGASVLNDRVKVSPPPLDEKFLKAWRARNKTEIEMQDRLLTDSRLENLWKKFNSLPNEKRLQQSKEFLTFVGMIRLDAQEMKLTKPEIQKIKGLQVKTTRQVRKLQQTIVEIDKFCSTFETKELVTRGELDGDQSYTKQLDRMHKELNNQLAFYHKNTLPRIHMFVGDKANVEKLTDIAKRAQSNFVDIFTREAVSILFTQWFNQPLHALAEDVAMVIAGIPHAPNTTRKQQQDRTRKRRKMVEYRSKKVK